MFDDIQKKINEGKERWKLIEGLAETIKRDIESTEPGPSNRDLGRLLLLIVEHLKPMNPSDDMLGDLGKGFNDLLSKLGKR